VSRPAVRGGRRGATGRDIAGIAAAIKATESGSDVGVTIAMPSRRGGRGNKSDAAKNVRSTEQGAFNDMTFEQIRTELLGFGVMAKADKAEAWSQLQEAKKGAVKTKKETRVQGNNPMALGPNVSVPAPTISNLGGTAQDPVDLTGSPNQPVAQSPPQKQSDLYTLMLGSEQEGSQGGNTGAPVPPSVPKPVKSAPPPKNPGSKQPTKKKDPLQKGVEHPTVSAPSNPPEKPFKLQGLKPATNAPGAFAAEGIVMDGGKFIGIGSINAAGDGSPPSGFSFEGVLGGPEPGQGGKRKADVALSGPSKKPKTAPEAAKPPAKVELLTKAKPSAKVEPTKAKPSKAKPTKAMPTTTKLTTTKPPTSSGRPLVLAGGLVIVRRHPRTGMPNEILLDWRVNDGKVNIPGGICNAGETPLEAAVREASEETGLASDKIHVWGRLAPYATDYDSKWGAVKYYTYYADCTDGSFKPRKSKESTAVRWTPLNKVTYVRNLHDGFAEGWPTLEKTVRGLPAAPQ
jgi:8-oxo-dGTP pyrophosphatase MutT (NUDIX family)